MKEIDFKILIVDEEQSFRNHLASKLRMQGYSVEFASGGFHLMHILEKSNEFKLIILHDDMPDMPAEEMISLVRIHKNKAELPILFISENSNDDDIFHIILTGANEYIVKTPNFQPIVDRTRKYFTLFKNS